MKSHMIELSRILELMYTAGQRSRSIRANLYEWWDEALHREIVADKHISARVLPQIPPEEGPLDVLKIVEKHTRLWAVLPDRLRWESELLLDGGEVIVDRGVRDGSAWWRTGPDGRIDSHTDHQRRWFVSAGFEHLLHPSRLLPALELTPRKFVQWSGRDAVELAATHRYDYLPDAVLDELGWPADGYEMTLDLERGVLLQTTARYGEQILKRHEVVEIAFDEPMPDELFASLQP